MKNCPACNIEFDDAQNFCSNCGGALVEKAPEVVEATPAVEAEPKKPLVLVILGFVGKISAILSAMFAACAVANPYFYVSLNYSSYSYKYYANSYFHPDEACSVFALLFALAAVGVAVVDFIMTLKNKPKIEKLFSAIAKLVGVTALFIVSLVLVANM